jgi:hypothetical protein
MRSDADATERATLIPEASGTLIEIGIAYGGVFHVD